MSNVTLGFILAVLLVYAFMVTDPPDVPDTQPGPTECQAFTHEGVTYPPGPCGPYNASEGE